MPREMDLADGWLCGARRLPSSNFSARPGDVEVSLLVIHNISLPPGVFGSGAVEALFCNCLDPDAHSSFRELHGLQVSAHMFIDRQGRLTQFVPLQYRAWHAGLSCYENRDNCNDFSIGIELEGVDDQAYSDAQYHCLVAATLTMMQAYPAITRQRIVGHCDIAPGRKTDPGPAFDWRRYQAALQVDDTSSGGVG